MIINTNVVADRAARFLGRSETALGRSLNRLSTGSKISNSSSDSAGIGMSTTFGAQLSRINAAKDNVGNAISYSQTQEGYLDEISSALDRMSELAMFALDGTKTDADRSLYDKEFQQVDDFISAVKGKDFNGISLFQGTTVLSVTISDSGLTTGGVGVTLTGGYWTSVASSSISNMSDAADALTDVKELIRLIGAARADVGANVTRFEKERSALSIQSESISEARSRIADVDVARESANFARQQILVQSGTAMLAHANVMPQSALRLIS